MDNSIDGTGHPPEVYGIITYVWAGTSPRTTSLWFINKGDFLSGKTYVASMPVRAVELFLNKPVRLHLLPNGIVTAISGIEGTK